MVPLLMCAYKPPYLRVVLNWLRSVNAEEKYRIFAWDNGGADAIFKEAGLNWHCVRDDTQENVINVGKALAMRYLMDVVNHAMPEADCIVCMDDDIIVDRDHLDALVATARRPEMGMIAPRIHPFNSVVPSGGTVSCFDVCEDCVGHRQPIGNTGCLKCGGLGRNPKGLRLRTYPREDRTVRNTGKIAGGLFAVSKASINRLPWAPYLYPILTTAEQKPAVYWTEDASLDFGLTNSGLINGYLEGSELTPVIHLPELNPDYIQWKLQARISPLTTPEFFANQDKSLSSTRNGP